MRTEGPTLFTVVSWTTIGTILTALDLSSHSRVGFGTRTSTRHAADATWSKIMTETLRWR